MEKYVLTGKEKNTTSRNHFITYIKNYINIYMHRISYETNGRIMNGSITYFYKIEMKYSTYS